MIPKLSQCCISFFSLHAYHRHHHHHHRRRRRRLSSGRWYRSGDREGE